MLFKYVHTDRIEVLEAGKIRFTQPSVLNDPYEMRPNLDVFKDLMARSHLGNRRDVRLLYRALFNQIVMSPTIKRAIKKLRKSDPHRFDEFLLAIIRAASDPEIEASWSKGFDRDMLILSLSRKPDNQLMWSHYADSHRGFVIGFDAGRLTEFLVGKYGCSLPISVTYSNKRFRLSGHEIQSTRTLGPMIDQATQQVQLKYNIGFQFDLFSTKSTDWLYEDEVRYFVRSSAGEVAPKTADLPRPIYLYKFPKEAVRAIIVGSNAEDSLADKLGVLQARFYPLADLLHATPDPDTFAMTLGPPDNLDLTPEGRMIKILNDYNLLV